MTELPVENWNRKVYILFTVGPAIKDMLLSFA